MTERNAEIERKAEEILLLCAGHPGPFGETDTGYFGRKKTDPSMKSAKMETNLGGMLVSKGPLTYGDADVIAKNIQVVAVADFIAQPRPNDYYFEKDSEGKMFIGSVWWVIYSYLASRKIIPGNPRNYNNGMEYLYNEILKKLVAEGYVVPDEKWLYFVMATKTEGVA